MSISKRSAATIASREEPWGPSPRQTYHQENNPNGLIALAGASNLLVTQDLIDFTNNNVEFTRPDFLYNRTLNAGLRFPSALAVHLNENLLPHTPIAPQHIRVASGVTSLNDMLAWALADAGEAFLTSRPVYGRFAVDMGSMSGVRIVYADTTAARCFDEDVVEEFERAWERERENGVRIRAVLIVNPHNPTGKCYPRQTLINMMKFCQKHNLHLLSDEIYACSVFDSGEETAVPFTSVLSIDPTGIIDPNLVHAQVGFSKDFAASGLRVGAVVSGNESVLKALDVTVRFFEPSGPSLAIATAMLEDRDWTRSFLASSRERIAAAYKRVTAGLRDMGVEYLRGSNAGFFLWVDFSPYLPADLNGEANAEFALANKFVAAGVYLHPREEKSLEPGWFRLVYTQDAAIITEALRRIRLAIGG